MEVGLGGDHPGAEGEHVRYGRAFSSRAPPRAEAARCATSTGSRPRARPRLRSTDSTQPSSSSWVLCELLLAPVPVVAPSSGRRAVSSACRPRSTATPPSRSGSRHRTSRTLRGAVHARPSSVPEVAVERDPEPRLQVVAEVGLEGPDRLLGLGLGPWDVRVAREELGIPRVQPHRRVSVEHP